MARVKKNLTLDEQLENIVLELDKAEGHVKKLKEQKKELENKIKQNRLAELEALIAQSGKTFDEVKELLSATK